MRQVIVKNLETGPFCKVLLVTEAHKIPVFYVIHHIGITEEIDVEFRFQFFYNAVSSCNVGGLVQNDIVIRADMETSLVLAVQESINVFIGIFKDIVIINRCKAYFGLKMLFFFFFFFLRRNSQAAAKKQAHQEGNTTNPMRDRPSCFIDFQSFHADYLV
jgi:hypothetical protein